MSQNQALDFVFFPGEDKELTALLNEMGTEQVYPKDSYIVKAPQEIHSIWCIKAGLCAYINGPLGNDTQIIGFLMPGYTFGHVPTASNMRRGVGVSNISVQTLTETTVVAISRSTLLEIISSTVERELLFLQHATERYSDIFHVTSNFSTYNTAQRLAIFFRSYVNNLKQKPASDGFYMLDLRIPHDILAQIAGTNRVTMTQLLNYLKKIDLIYTEGQSIYFHKKIITNKFITDELTKKKWTNIRQLYNSVPN